MPRVSALFRGYRTKTAALACVTLGAAMLLACSCGSTSEPRSTVSGPAATAPGSRMSLDTALGGRVSTRAFAPDRLSGEQVSKLLWAAQGRAGGVDAETSATRTAPSAGGLHPLKVYCLTASTLSEYEPATDAVTTVSARVDRGAFEGAAGQPFVSEAPAVFVLAADAGATEEKYGDRADRYVLLEAGHSAQNILLEAEALGLGAVPVGAFDDAAVRSSLGLPANETVLYLVPVGYPLR